MDCLWDFPDKNTGLGCHFLLQGIFLTQELNPKFLPCLLNCRWVLYHWVTGEAHEVPGVVKIIDRGSKLVKARGCEMGMSEWVNVAQSCLTLCDPMDYTVHGILQARILEWVAFPFTRGSSKPRDQTQVSCIAGRSYCLTSIKFQCCKTKRFLDVDGGDGCISIWTYLISPYTQKWLRW